MSSVSSDDQRDRRRAVTTIRASLRALSVQMSLLNHQVGARLGLKDGDLYCLDLIDQHGSLSPSALARLAGLHPATMTGVLDRLERAGWIARERDPADRRAVLVRPNRERGVEILGLYAGMNTAMGDLLAGYDPAELDLLADFLRRTTEAGRAATDTLATE